MYRVFNIALIIAISTGVVSQSRAERAFEPLFQLMVKSGECHVRLPGNQQLILAKNGKAYPFGTRIITGEKSEVTAFLSASDQINVSASTTLEIIQPEEKLRKVFLVEGKIKTYLADEVVGEGEQLSNRFIVESAAATCDKIIGTVRYEVKIISDTTSMTVKSETGDTRITGPQFVMPTLGNNTEVQIVSARDDSVTTLRCTDGDCIFDLERGSDDPLSIKVRSSVISHIWRTRTKTSNRLVVAVQVAKANGETMHLYTFAEGEKSENRFNPSEDVAKDDDVFPDEPSNGFLDTPDVAEPEGSDTEPEDTGSFDFGGF